MTLYNVHIQTASQRGDWSGAISSPTIVLDSEIQGIVSTEHAETIVRNWLMSAGLEVISVGATARPSP